MTLKDCLEIGVECGLQTVSEAILNIGLHATSVFSYCNLDSQLRQLYRETEEVFSETEFSADSKNHDVLNWIKLRNRGKYEGKGFSL